jgi:hypothetical protein
MERITHQRLMELAGARQFPLLSIYMPTNGWRTSQSGAEDMARFAALAGAAEEQLVARGVRRTTANRTTDSLRRCIEYELSRRGTHQGLAVFFSPRGSHIVGLPAAPPERAIVSGRFYLKPLLSSLERQGCFYLLAASEKSVRFFAGDQFDLTELDVPFSLENLEEASNPEASGAVLPAVATAGSGRQAGIFHGLPCAEARCEADLETCFRAVDRALSPTLSRTSAPLIFAGASYLFPLYRSINRYAYLLGECILGDPGLYSNDELRRRAWSLAVPFYARSREMALTRFNRFHGTGRASNNLHEVLWMAREGRVESLLLASDGDHWGIIDYDRRAVQPAAPTDPRAEELLDYVAVHAFLNRAAVYFLNRSQLPGGELAAAVYRDPPLEVENASAHVPLARDQRPQTIGFQAVHS